MKRLLDILLASAGLLLASPFLGLLALVIRCTSGAPVFFRQTRIGWLGRSFCLYKFRTMRLDTDEVMRQTGVDGGAFDAGNVSRVTSVGHFLRTTKLDELPQLWNVIKGDMSLVGPRPEVPKWVDVYPERWSRVLTVRPGMTDPASIIYRNEESILARSADAEQTYRDEILPHKLDLYEEYVRTHTLRGDLGILLKTVRVVITR